MIFYLQTPQQCSSWVPWVFDFILMDAEGVSYSTSESQDEEWILQYDNKYIRWKYQPNLRCSVAEMEIPHTLQQIKSKELSEDKTIHILYGDSSITFEKNGISLGFDPFTTIFNFLSRSEETHEYKKDIHGRFPGTESLAYKFGLLERPIADEYVAFLWCCIHHVWPEIEKKPKDGKILVTCDVDFPYDCGIKKIGTLIREIGGDIIERTSLNLAVKRLYNRFAARRGNFKHDPFNTFDWYLNTCEKYNRKATFFFIADNSAHHLDGCYSLEEPYVKNLISTILQRGHDIGVHGSYNSFYDPGRIINERSRMISTCKNIKKDVVISGYRQHYLRWDASQTPDYLEAADYEFDSSGWFPDCPGFRYGTSRSFQMWSWGKNAPLKLQQYPIAVMDNTIILKRYLGLGHTQESLNRMLSLKKRALQYGGNFTLIWHNSRLLVRRDREFFIELIR